MCYFHVFPLGADLTVLTVAGSARKNPASPYRLGDGFTTRQSTKKDGVKSHIPRNAGVYAISPVFWACCLAVTPPKVCGATI
jgi:hypothetical protein